jgi:hypothetical protein
LAAAVQPRLAELALAAPAERVAVARRPPAAGQMRQAPPTPVALTPPSAAGLGPQPERSA